MTHEKLLFRFALAFDGEPQGVGLFTGLRDVGLRQESEDRILEGFKELKIPAAYGDPEAPGISTARFWFTEEGVA